MKRNPSKVQKARGAKQLPKGSERNARTIPGRSASEKLEQTKAKRSNSTGGRTPRKKVRASSKPANYKPSTGQMAPNTKTSYSLRPGLAKPGANAPSGLDASTKGSGQKASKVKSPVKKPKMQKLAGGRSGKAQRTNASSSKASYSTNPKMGPNAGPQKPGAGLKPGQSSTRTFGKGGAGKFGKVAAKVGKKVAGRAVAGGRIGGPALAAAGALYGVAEVVSEYDKSRSKGGQSTGGRSGRVRRQDTSSSSAPPSAPQPDKKPLTGKVVKGAPPGTMAAGAKKARDAQSREWVKSFKAPPKSETGTKSAPSTKGGGRKSPGYTYTGPKVGSAEYKAMRQKKYEANKAKARRNIAASRKGPASSKIKTVQRQQGTQKPNYESYQRGMRAPDSRQVKWTDNETTNQNLKASALRAQGDSGDKPKRSKLYGVRKVLSAMGYAGEVR